MFKIVNQVTSIQKPGTILIFDDFESSKELREKLTTKGYECIGVENTLKAFEHLNSNSIDVAILDVMMENHTCFDLLPELVQKFPNTSIIAVSGDFQPQIVVECMKLGAQDYILKPFNFGIVTNRIEEVFHKRQIESMEKAYKNGLEDKVAEQAKQIRELYLNSVDALVTALEAKDAYTAGHSRRVSQLAVTISKRMNYTPYQIDELHWGSLLHDVGKIAIDPKIQNKPDKLTTKEYEQIMKHTIFGPQIVKSLVNKNIINMLKFHHNRYESNNHNNPEGQDIISTRIITLADAFDAMTSDRPYRKSMTVDEAIAEIKRCTGTQFDPKVVRAFLAIPTTELRAILMENRFSNTEYPIGENFV